MRELDEVREALSRARQAAKRLTVFRGVLRDPLLSRAMAFLDALLSDGADPGFLLDEYHSLFAMILEAAEEPGGFPVGNPWQNHLIDLILTDENPFSRRAELRSPAGHKAGPVAGPADEALKEAATADLGHLRAVFELNSRTLAEALSRAQVRDPGLHLPDWEGVVLLSREAGPPTASGLRELFAESADWGRLLDPLTDHYATNGCGIFGKYRAFRWVGRNGSGASEGVLEGIAYPDPIHLSDLIGYEEERAEVVNNTLQFLDGFPANNLLLYGDRGTGKSSTVKALLNEFAGRGLRLVEVPKQNLGDYPEIARTLRKHRGRFILFVDDLSFDEGEGDFRTLKPILDGGIEERSDNVLIYATSNRRHLVRESFGDRGDGDEVHVLDTLQEKLSFSDRFGITVTFLAPDQEAYLEIVQGLAGQRGLEIPRDELRRLALRWEMLHNGRSGRTARQFVDHLAWELYRKDYSGLF